jgi:hypothetical protein
MAPRSTDGRTDEEEETDTLRFNHAGYQIDQITACSLVVVIVLAPPPHPECADGFRSSEHRLRLVK